MEEEAAEDDDDNADPDAPIRLPGLLAAELSAKGATAAAAAEDEEEEGSEEEESAEEEDDDGDSDGESSDSSYEAFDLTDNRDDLRKVPRPRTLRKCLAGFRAKDGEHELVDAALEAAEGVIRTHAENKELHTMAPPLFRALLHLPDQYKLPLFAERRHGALVALSVRCPAEAADFLTREFYSEHLSLEMRMQALRTVNAMAEELAAPPPKEYPEPAPSAYEDRVEAAALAQRRGEVKTPMVKVGHSTRYFNSGPRKAPEAAPSLLGAVAPRFFFPLMGRYDDPANTFKLLTEDCFLLEALLHTLAAILRGVAAYRHCRPMARALFEFAWVLRMHDESAVRRGALISLCAVGRTVLPAILISEYEAALPELQEWLRKSAENDPDDGCRQLSAACHAIYGNAVRSQMPSLSDPFE